MPRTMLIGVPLYVVSAGNIRPSWGSMGPLLVNSKNVSRGPQIPLNRLLAEQLFIHKL